MVKSVKSVAHRGLRDWVLQRVSAVIVAVYTLWLFSFLVSHASLSYGEWHHLFSQINVKIATIMFLVALLVHAWIGIWTVLTDYVKPVLLRGTLSLIFILMLVAFFIWGLLIVGSV